MKKYLVLILLILLSGCTYKAKAISNYQEWDKLISSRKDNSLAYDLRDASSCLEGHISSFVCIFYSSDKTIDLKKVEENITKIYNKKTLILLICADGLDSSQMASSLAGKGYKKVYYYVGGYNQYIIDNPNFEAEIGCNC